MNKVTPKRLLKDSLYSKHDVYYRKAKQDCFRARSAYKLLQIDQLFQIFNQAERVIDLCAAPGSWTQVCARKLADKLLNSTQTRIVSVDLQQMAQIQGVVQIQGDITKRKTVQQILFNFKGGLASLVISDGAPDVTGLHDMDQYLQSQLLVAALNICIQTLEEGCNFVGKVFKGSQSNFLFSQFKLFFEQVYLIKPNSSRESSVQHFIVCLSFKAKERPELFSFMPEKNKGVQSKLQKFVLCGDLSGFDECQ